MIQTGRMWIEKVERLAQIVKVDILSSLYDSRLALMWAINLSISLKLLFRSLGFDKKQCRNNLVPSVFHFPALSSLASVSSRTERWGNLWTRLMKEMPLSRTVVISLTNRCPYKGLYSFAYWVFRIFLVLCITFCTLHINISILYMTQPFDGFLAKRFFL